MSAIHTILDMAVDSLGQLADADIVTGRTIQVGGKTIVPILKLSVSRVFLPYLSGSCCNPPTVAAWHRRHRVWIRKCPHGHDVRLVLS